MRCDQILTLLVFLFYTIQITPQFVKTNGTNFILNNKPFFYSGTNNYYLHYQSNFMINDVFKSAQKMNLKVIRTWGFIDRGSLDGRVGDIDPPGHKAGVYFQFWNTTLQRPDFNEGKFGLQRLDNVIYLASQYGLKLIIVLVNNWKEFGGMDQYILWYNLKYHDDFYTNEKCKNAYKQWIKKLLNRKNTFTGMVYKDDPTIMAWGLANEPRCSGSGRYPRSSSCTTKTITNWINEMSAFVRQYDKNHLIASGDEGFFSRGGSDWTYNGFSGVDFDAILKLPNINFGTMHLYPDHWQKSLDWSSKWIKDHQESSVKVNKPVILEEFGYKDKAKREQVYSTWTDLVYRKDIAGDNFWMLCGKLDNGTNYPDYDGFAIYHPSSVATRLSKHAERMNAKN